MEFVDIAGASLAVSRIGLGTWSIGGWMWGGSDEAEAIGAIHEAMDRGVNLIDTAPVYGFGHAEEIVGKALKQGGRRERAVIATKAGLEWKDGRPFRNARRERILKEIDDSLRRLQTDVIDIYQVHWPDPETPTAETAGVMAELYRAGKIRAVGVSNFSPEQMEEFSAVAPLHTVQPPYNLFERGAERDILPYAKRKGLTAFAYGAICRGLLSGQITRDTQFSGDDLRNRDPKFQPDRRPQYIAAVERLARFAREAYGKEVIHLALRWALDRGDNIVALWGARKRGQLAPIDGVMGWRLDAGAMAEIDRIIEETVTSPVGPEFMAPP
ncbi:general stress protein [Methylocystis heyeri]|uniref:General stress protein n=2 Tax=Methylocystis heyeri TaxID=391905 RepID=A0A6B8KK20_9HYPH|nr:general stress protein [Methylocystis heyeri]